MSDNNESIKTQLDIFFTSASLEIAQRAKRIIRKNARACRDRIKDRSPVDTTSGTVREHGVYKNGWRVSIVELPLSIECTVHNYRRPYLTWLLENGHLLADGSRTKKQPHIEVSAQQQEEIMLREMKEFE